MIKALPIAALCLLPLGAAAGVPEVIARDILPGTAGFAEATQALSEASDRDCTMPAMAAPYGAAFDAWLAIAHLRFGPLEEAGRDRAIAFWPDAKGFTPRMLTGLIADQDPVVATPEGFAEVSVAARGLFALERMLYDPQFAYGPDSYGCALTRAISHDLARMAGAIDTEWRDSQAGLMRDAGAPGNTAYLSPDEAARQLYTALLSGLEFNADGRLGRPLGSFDDPRPERAEARRSERSRRNLVLSLQALHGLARDLAGADIPLTDAAFESAIARAEALEDPSFADAADPSGRLKIEIVQQRVQAVRRAVEGEIGPILGVGAGFNSADGD
ncbi:imelysin family protein [Pseudooceanicola sp. CBS1P-1]|uniref:Signal peptidase n=1 Tax=Pseudooceanicola albus TaxID=2692189 RepID=A0A6L7G6X4_9RHOB|nr:MULTISPECIES: imelysin family protein [Pseudooceanicola]MBT9383090.1 imelysin family protein [Pseudooceanicola endophyticus]MXN19278.1 signal peptidase [Pseudooceanicola albus]